MLACWAGSPSPAMRALVVGTLVGARRTLTTRQLRACMLLEAAVTLETRSRMYVLRRVNSPDPADVPAPSAFGFCFWVSAIRRAMKARRFSSASRLATSCAAARFRCICHRHRPPSAAAAHTPSNATAPMLMAVTPPAARASPPGEEGVDAGGETGGKAGKRGGGGGRGSGGSAGGRGGRSESGECGGNGGGSN